MVRARLAGYTACLGLAGAVVVLGAIVPSARSSDSEPCPNAAPAPNDELEPEATPRFKKTLPGEIASIEFHDPPEGSRFSLPFADSHVALKKQVRIGAASELPSSGLNNDDGLNARFGGTQTLRGPGGRDISAEQRGVQKSLVRMSGSEIGLCLRLDAAELEVSPGTYRGTLALAYKQEPRAAVPVEASFRGSWPKAMVIAFLGVSLGLVVKTLSEAAAIARKQRIRGRRALQVYTSQLEFFVILILAVVAGVFVYVLQYLHDPDWGAEATDSLRLFATCFVLQMGSSEALGVVSRVAGVETPALRGIPR